MTDEEQTEPEVGDSDVSESGEPEAEGRSTAEDVVQELKKHEEEAEAEDGEESAS